MPLQSGFPSSETLPSAVRAHLLGTDYIDGESIEAIFAPSELAELLAFRQSLPPALMGLLLTHSHRIFLSWSSR